MKHPVETALSNSPGTYKTLEIARRSDAIFLYTSSEVLTATPSSSPHRRTTGER